MANLKKNKQKTRKPAEAKGKGAIRTGGAVPTESDVIGTLIEAPLPILPTLALTSHDIFLLCIERAKNLIKIHKAAHGKKSKPEKYLADAHRAAVVLAVSALDAFIRTFVIARIRILLGDTSERLPPRLVEKITKVLKPEDLLQAARRVDLQERVEKAFRAILEKQSFQGTKNISQYMTLVGYDDIFHEVAVQAGLNEDTLKKQLDGFTERRHIIAHKGDYDLSENPPKENIITKKYAEDCIRLVTTVAQYIQKLQVKK